VDVGTGTREDFNLGETTGGMIPRESLSFLRSGVCARPSRKKICEDDY
jgi:hypothetical protein